MATDKDKDTSDSNESDASTDPDPMPSSGPAAKPDEAAHLQTSANANHTTEDITVDQPIGDLGSDDVLDMAAATSDKSNITDTLQAMPGVTAPEAKTEPANNPFSDDTTDIITETDSPLPETPKATPAPSSGETIQVNGPADQIPSPTQISSSEASASVTSTPEASNSSSVTAPRKEGSTPAVPTMDPPETLPIAALPKAPDRLAPTPGPEAYKAATLDASSPSSDLPKAGTSTNSTATSTPASDQTKPEPSTEAAPSDQTTAQIPTTDSSAAKPGKDQNPVATKKVEISAEKASAEATTVVNQKSGTPQPSTPTASTPVPNALGTSPPISNQPTEKLVTPSPKPTIQPPTPTQTPLRSSFETKKGGKGKLLALLLVPIFVLAAFFGAWALDQNSRGERVARNTEINGVDISGLTGDELSIAITEATDSVLDIDLMVNANDDSIVTTPRVLGAEADIETITEDALKSRRSGFFLARPFGWASSFLRTDQVSATYLVDQKAADEASQTIFEPLIEPVAETSIEVQGSGFVVVPGKNGERIEATEIEAELPDALGGSNTPVLELTPVEGVPQISGADAKAAADEASAALDEPLEVQLLDKTTTVEPDELLKMVALDNSGNDLTWMIDNDLAVDELKKKFTSVGSDGEEASFTVVNDTPVVVPVASAVECCDETTGQRIKETAVDRPAEGGFVVVEPEYVDEDPTADELNSFGIIEEISSFTTPHAADGPRVTNIQRFADLMRGTVIEVDEELSLNETVGERTIEKGFVADGAINQGVIEQQVGGGISQFATTFFNTSFFAGIEIQEHQFHTLAIGSRYPLGRESTIDYPSVDVRVKNTSEHPILVWTSYTNTSITVTFYSQKHLTVRDTDGNELAFDVYEQGRDSTFPPEIGSDRQCKVYTTRRFTEFPDGDIVEDSFSGFYRPGEGQDCNGDLTPKAQAELDAMNAADDEDDDD